MSSFLLNTGICMDFQEKVYAKILKPLNESLGARCNLSHQSLSFQNCSKKFPSNHNKTENQSSDLQKKLLTFKRTEKILQVSLEIPTHKVIHKIKNYCSNYPKKRTQNKNHSKNSLKTKFCVCTLNICTKRIKRSKRRS